MVTLISIVVIDDEEPRNTHTKQQGQLNEVKDKLVDEKCGGKISDDSSLTALLDEAERLSKAERRSKTDMLVYINNFPVAKTPGMRCFSFRFCRNSSQLRQ